jgi:hypothetical protein
LNASALLNLSHLSFSMLYSAINLRGALRPPKPTASSFFHLCVGYYNVVLPSFLIPALGDSKRQTLAAVKSKFLVTRAMAMSTFRERQALGWAKVDDAAAERKMREEEAKKGESGGVLPSVTEKLVAGVESLKVSVEQAVPNGKGEESSKATPTAPTLAPTASSAIPSALGLPKAPQAALMGVSFLGNLDAISNCSSFPPNPLSQTVLLPFPCIHFVCDLTIPLFIHLFQILA